MRSALLQQAAQPATPATAAAAAQARGARSAEEAQLDARIELAAKKAALAGLEAQVGPAIADIPMPPGMPSGRIVIERDGKTIILDNPTAEQIAAVGGAGSSSAPDSETIVTLAGSTLLACVAVVWIVMHYFKRNRSAVPTTAERDLAGRMARIENAIESIAVEVERISEGQRFTSKLLAEGAAVPVGVGDRNDAVLQPRREN